MMFRLPRGVLHDLNGKHEITSAKILAVMRNAYLYRSDKLNLHIPPTYKLSRQ